mmetsp:Transcript_6829/g.9735  ORF Transcript_6829/g.9735 Transcript_6829/m.9735 type:complete len:227 (+) Transcript_6829:257-937(+)
MKLWLAVVQKRKKKNKKLPKLSMSSGIGGAEQNSSLSEIQTSRHSSLSGPPQRHLRLLPQVKRDAYCEALAAATLARQHRSDAVLKVSSVDGELVGSEEGDISLICCNLCFFAGVHALHKKLSAPKIPTTLAESQHSLVGKEDPSIGILVRQILPTFSVGQEDDGRALLSSLSAMVFQCLQALAIYLAQLWILLDQLMVEMLLERFYHLRRFAAKTIAAHLPCFSM